MIATLHARTRMQQRSIPVAVIDLLLDYGTREHARDHAAIVYFDKKGRAKLAQDLKRDDYKLIEKKLNSLVFPGTQGGPLMHAIAAKAVAFKEAMQPEFKSYQEQVVVNARVMSSVMMQNGFNVISSGTDNHLFLLDLVDKGLTGKDAEAALGRANITTNKNCVPNDPQSPFVTRGIRIGTSAMTMRGFGKAEARQLANAMCRVLDSMDDDAVRAEARG